MREDGDMQRGSGYSVSLMARTCEFIDILEADFWDHRGNPVYILTRMTTNPMIRRTSACRFTF